MLFKNYLEKVLGSKVKIGVVRSLLKFPDKSFTARELAGFTKVSHTPVLKSLKDLLEMGLIDIEKHGTSNLIKLNKNSYLYGPLRELFNYEANTRKKLVSKIKEIIVDAEMVILFGSVQKGNEKMNSDIDILIVTKNRQKIYKEIEEKQNSVMREFGNVLSPIILTKKQFINKKNKPFARDLIKNYGLIKGNDLIKTYWK